MCSSGLVAVASRDALSRSPACVGDRHSRYRGLASLRERFQDGAWFGIYRTDPGRDDVDRRAETALISGYNPVFHTTVLLCILYDNRLQYEPRIIHAVWRLDVHGPYVDMGFCIA